MQCSVVQCIILFRIVSKLYCIGQYCIKLYCIGQCCTENVLYCHAESEAGSTSEDEDMEDVMGGAVKHEQVAAGQIAYEIEEIGGEEVILID